MLNPSLAPNPLFKIRPRRAFGDEVKRILLEQVDLALWELTAPDLDMDAAVHETRKCCKRVRGILRLVRDDIGENSFTALNTLFRDAARLLSTVRTSAVLSETLTKLQQCYPDQFDDTQMAMLTQRLQRHHQKLQDAIAPQETLFSQVVGELQAGRTQIEALSLPQRTLSVSGLKRVYRRGRRGLRRSQMEPTVLHLHEWRKRVKYLRYHMRILAPMWPEALDCVTDELVVLSELLGLDHDLADLYRTFAENPELCLREDGAEGMLRRIAAYRTELEAHCFIMGARLYYEKPTTFVQRMFGYWEIWQAEQDSPQHKGT